MVKDKLIGLIMILLSGLIYIICGLFIVETLTDLAFLTMGILIAELFVFGILLIDRNVKRKME